MGQGIELAKQLGGDPRMIAALEDLKEQLLVVLLEKLGGKSTISVTEIDQAPVGKILTMNFDQERREFTFEVKKKH